ncbi:912_t:CDS:1, partial [Entrophospora sp. SA101]
ELDDFDKSSDDVNDDIELFDNSFKSSDSLFELPTEIKDK